MFSAFGEDIHQDFTMSDNVIVAGDLVADSLEMDDPLYVWPEEKEFRVVLFRGAERVSVPPPCLLSGTSAPVLKENCPGRDGGRPFAIF